ncbi:MAG TPA: FAD-dependent oxidoreductase [Solirubrobacteraceae bacterium]|nr:FAD-dependent oxidoreductase [Solirubrobacteraceae bacterium]
MNASERRHAPHIVIAGGGVAAVEGLIAIRELLDGLVHVTLVAPGGEFVYRPLLVAEPFGLGERHSFDLETIAADHSATLVRGRLAGVDGDAARIALDDGTTLDYDALLVAIGARPREWLAGAIHFSSPAEVSSVRELAWELDQGRVRSVVFAGPTAAAWTLPLYELALLTAAHVGESGTAEVELTIVTPESEPLAAFGLAAAEHIRDLCSDRGIRLRTGVTATAFEDGRVELDTGEGIEADRVVALPALSGEELGGMPHDREGFIPVDEHCAVRGLRNVYAAGDGIAYPVKQGGLGTQQADAAARAIAARLGAAVEPTPFRPELRGLLLTGLGPSYLHAVPGRGGKNGSVVALNPLWWPPSKIAGRHLAPYLAGLPHVPTTAQVLEDRPPSHGDAAQHDAVRELAMIFADQDARHGDHRSALAWLDTLEQIDGVLSPELEARRTLWRAAREKD